jgi:hypothetical protein
MALLFNSFFIVERCDAILLNALLQFILQLDTSLFMNKKEQLKIATATKRYKNIFFMMVSLLVIMYFYFNSQPNYFFNTSSCMFP